MDISKVLPILNAVSSIGTPKAGVSSTEFWLHGAVSAYAALSPAVPAPWNIIVPMVSASIYSLGRSVIKAAHATGKLPDVPDLPEKP